MERRQPFPRLAAATPGTTSTQRLWLPTWACWYSKYAPGTIISDGIGKAILSMTCILDKTQTTNFILASLFFKVEINFLNSHLAIIVLLKQHVFPSIASESKMARTAPLYAILARQLNDALYRPHYNREGYSKSGYAPTTAYILSLSA